MAKVRRALTLPISSPTLLVQDQSSPIKAPLPTTLASSSTRPCPPSFVFHFSQFCSSRRSSYGFVITSSTSGRNTSGDCRPQSKFLSSQSPMNPFMRRGGLHDLPIRRPRVPRSPPASLRVLVWYLSDNLYRCWDPTLRGLFSRVIHHPSLLPLLHQSVHDAVQIQSFSRIRMLRFSVHGAKRCHLCVRHQ
jgi:hypothetical protein